MNTRLAQISAGLFFLGALVASANAEYRCDPAPSPFDARACAAARQGPEALRRYVNSWAPKMSNLQFSDYVDAKTERAWEAKAAMAKQPSDAVKVSTIQK